ncbi:hypothetical protein D1912_12175, partial [Escherichia coli]
YSSLKCINEINDILRAINVWRISCLSGKYLESRSQKIKKPAGEAGSFIYNFDVKLLIMQHGAPTNEL